MPSFTWSRRRFLQLSGAGATLSLAGWGYTRAQRRLRLGLIGCGGRGKQLAATLRWTRPRPLYGEITAVCDVDRRRAAALREAYCGEAEIYDNDRRLLERDDLDGVIIAAPDHWHTPLSLAALRSGKAVYCEKPLTLTVDEGRLLTAAAAKTNLAFQVGTQQRSDWRFRTACELVRNGRLGLLHRIQISLPTGSLPPTSYGGPFDDEPPPPELNWDRWLGQAPIAPFCKQRFDPFRWWYEYSGGFLTDWGAHHLDIAHWAMGFEHRGPTSIEGRGPLPQIANGYNTPRSFTVDLKYANGVDVRIALSAKTNGIHFDGDRGTLFVSRHRICGPAYDELSARPLQPDAVRYGPPSPPWGTPTYLHLLDWLHAIETGTTPISDVASQHRTATACHLANISLRLGRKLRWDPLAEQVIDDPEATAMLSRPQRAGYEIA
jgi:myo-inositol 2-dehydrogenase/D-chiro-inositol 1-dehydrogenase